MKDEKPKMKNELRIPGSFFVFSFFILHFALLLSSCGFHLRGSAATALPEPLARLRVSVADSRLVNDALLVAMKNALEAEAGVVVTDAADAPLLTLFGERTDTQVLSVSTSGRASGYLLKYEVSYRLADSKGAELLAPQSVRLLRDYTFDPINVLAKEQEEAELKRVMQRDAIQQILRRLSRYQSATTPLDATQR
jgi:LPS-assembly lipoprotein